jgi:hypothetical protein
MKFRKKERIRKLDSYIGIKREGAKIPSKILNEYFRIFRDALFSKKDKRDAEMIVHYLKIYSLLNDVLNLLTKENYKNAFNRIEIVKNLTMGIVPIREQGYSRNINDIVNEIYRDKNKIVSARNFNWPKIYAY